MTPFGNPEWVGLGDGARTVDESSAGQALKRHTE
jgi:hypothetical protein